MRLRRAILVLMCVISISPLFALAGGVWWVVQDATSIKQSVTHVISQPVTMRGGH